MKKIHFARAVAILSVLVSVVFTAVAVLIYPLWADISAFLGTDFPVMLIAAMLGGLYGAVLVYVLATHRWQRRWLPVLFAFIDLVMVGLLIYLLSELGTERVVLYRQFINYLPCALWFGVIIAYVGLMPRWKWLQTGIARLALLFVLIGSALLWLNRPYRFMLESHPAVYLHGDGVVVAWGTNMTATGEVSYSVDGQPAQVRTNQTDGLQDLGDQIVRVFVPLSSWPTLLNLSAASEGIKAVNPISVQKLGRAASDNVAIPFPAQDVPISFVSFSDLHEQADIYNRLASHIPWDATDLAVYNGDLLNNTQEASQVLNSILSLPTGKRDLPRVFVRGNHETRGAAARQLDEWLLPADGHWYHSFSLGNTFFIVLDGGEDKLDTHEEYGGLVDFTAYHQEPAAWLQRVLASAEFHNAQYRVVLLHLPIFGVGEAPPSFEPVAAQLRDNTSIDLMVNGHTHESGIFTPDETGLPYPVAISGGPEEKNAAVVRVSADQDALHIQIIDVNGVVLKQFPES